MNQSDSSSKKKMCTINFEGLHVV